MAAFKAAMNRVPQGMGSGLMGLGFAGLIAYGVNESVYTVDGGHRAILFSRLSGVQSEVYSEGLHFRIPWFQWPIIFDIRAKPHRITSISGTKDLQMVNVSIRVLSRPSPSDLPSIYRNLGTDYDERVLPSIVTEVLKSEMARFNASQLITQRERVSELIRERLTERATEFWIQLDDVSITDLRFGDEYSKAVENKQIAQQDAQRAALLVEQARQARQQKIVEAEGEAKAAELIGKAIQKNPGFLSLRRIEAARTIASTVSSSNNKVFLDSTQLLLNVEDVEPAKDALKAGSGKPAAK